jgi:hypothetical protein
MILNGDKASVYFSGCQIVIIFLFRVISIRL